MVMCPQDAEGIANGIDTDQIWLLTCVCSLPRPTCPKTLDHYGKANLFYQYLAVNMQQRKKYVH